jgi:hypothetical protein
MAWGTYRPFGPLKASLTKPIRQQMLQNVEFYIIYGKLLTNWVSKPSIFLPSYLLSFYPSFPPPLELFIKCCFIYHLSSTICHLSSVFCLLTFCNFVAKISIDFSRIS